MQVIAAIMNYWRQMKKATTHKSPNKKYQAIYVVCSLFLITAIGNLASNVGSPTPYR
jgi:hypothetical protein